MFKLIAPFSVQLSKNKKFRLNFNEYRNAHYFKLNKAKQLFNNQMIDQIDTLPEFKQINITYTIFPKGKREFDVTNSLVVVDKFFQDCLVNNNKIKDDNYKYVRDVHFSFGYIDSENPRIEIVIKPIKYTL